MKTWEMIKELTENPKKKFISHKGTSCEMLAQIKHGCLYIEDRLRGFTSIDMERKWEEVKEPVSWKKAFEAGLHGKRIKPVGEDLTFPDYENLIYVFKYLTDRPHFFNEIILGNWYIED